MKNARFFAQNLRRLGTPDYSLEIVLAKVEKVGAIWLHHIAITTWTRESVHSVHSGAILFRYGDSEFLRSRSATAMTVGAPYQSISTKVRQFDRVLAGVADSAVQGIGYDKGFVGSLAVLKDGLDARRILAMLAAYAPATEAAGAVGGPVTVPTVHDASCLLPG
jgi:hypothetical protein